MNNAQRPGRTNLSEQRVVNARSLNEGWEFSHAGDEAATLGESQRALGESQREWVSGHEVMALQAAQLGESQLSSAGEPFKSSTLPPGSSRIDG